MTTSKTYSFNNIFVFSVFLSLFGCGNTLDKNDFAAQIFNGNSANQVVTRFQLTKLHDVADFDRLPKNFMEYKNQLLQFDFYLAQSPTQPSGGFIFETSPNTNPLIICLKKPSPMSMTTSALTNPIALIRVKKGLAVSSQINYCE